MTSEPGSGRCPYPTESRAAILNYGTIRQQIGSPDLSPIFNTASHIAQTVFQENLEIPTQIKERSWVLDDAQELVIFPGSLGLPVNIEVDTFLGHMFSSVNDLLHRVDNREHVADLLQLISRNVPLFTYGIEKTQVAEIKESFKMKGEVTDDRKHDYALSSVNQFLRGAYGLMIERGIEAAGMARVQPIANYVALRKTLRGIEADGNGLSQESVENAFLTVNSDRVKGAVEDVRGFLFGGVNEGLRISVAAIDGMRIAVKEWNTVHAEEAVDFYEFAETEGRKWIAVMAAGHLTPTFELLRGLCGKSYASGLPKFPSRTLGLGKYNGILKMGFRVSELSEENLLILQTMNTAYTAGSPRTKCPALGILAEELYLQTLNIYKQSMSE